MKHGGAPSTTIIYTFRTISPQGHDRIIGSHDSFFPTEQRLQSLMSKASKSPKPVLGIIKKHETPKLDPKIRLFQIDNKRISFRNNPNLDPIFRSNLVRSDGPGFFGVGPGSRVTSQDTSCADTKLPEREIFASLHRKTSSQSVEAGNRDLFQKRDHTRNSRPDFTLQDSKKANGIRAVAEAFEARKRVQVSPTKRVIPTSNMSSQLTKVLAKDACPRE